MWVLQELYSYTWFVTYVQWVAHHCYSDEDDDLDNAYELLGLEDDAGEKEIKAGGTWGIHWNLLDHCFRICWLHQIFFPRTSQHLIPWIPRFSQIFPSKSPWNPYGFMSLRRQRIERSPWSATPTAAGRLFCGPLFAVGLSSHQRGWWPHQKSEMIVVNNAQ